MNENIGGPRRNAEADWEHDIWGANKNERESMARECH
jgi:hypothetical protein